MPPQSHSSSGAPKIPAPIRLGKSARRGKSSAGVLRRRTLDAGPDPAGDSPVMPTKEH
jgi:hypothetical protein